MNSTSARLRKEPSVEDPTTLNGGRICLAENSCCCPSVCWSVFWSWALNLALLARYICYHLAKIPGLPSVTTFLGYMDSGFIE